MLNKFADHKCCINVRLICQRNSIGLIIESASLYC